MGWQDGTIIDGSPADVAPSGWRSGVVVDDKPQQQQPESPPWWRSLGAGVEQGLTGLADLGKQVFSPAAPVTEDMQARAMAADPRFAAAAKAHGMDPMAAAADAIRSQSSASYWLDKALSVAPGGNPEDVPAPTTRDKVIRAAGAGLGTGLLPVGEGYTAANVVKNALMGGAAGATGEEAAAQVPEPLQPLARLAGGLVGGVGAAGAIKGVGVGAGAARGFTDPIMAGVSNAAAERQAAAEMKARTMDPTAVTAAIEKGGDPLVPGSSPTTYQLTGDTGLGSLERELTNNDVNARNEFLKRSEEQNAARVTQLQSIEQGGNPVDVAQAIKSNFDAIDHEHSANIANATLDAQDKASALGGEHAPEVQGGMIRDALSEAEGVARTRERGLWQAIDPEGKLTGNMTSVSAAADKIADAISRTAKPPEGEEADVLGLARTLPPLAPVNDLVALRSRLSTAMRNELVGNGNSPAYARMAQLRGAIQDALANTISEKIADQAPLVTSGAIPADQAIAAKLQAWFDDFQQRKAATGDSSGGPGGGPSVPGPANDVAGADGAGLPPGGGPGGPAGDQALPGDAGTPSFDDAARERLAAATAATKARARTFGYQPVGPALAKNGASDLFKMPEAAVPAKFWHPGPQGGTDAMALVKAAGADKAMQLLTDAATASLRKAAIGDDGVMNPAAYMRWRNAHAEALKVLPDEARARFADAASAGRAVTEATANSAAALKEAQQGAIGKLMGASEPEDVTRMIGQVLGSKTAVADMRRLADLTRKDPLAMQGLRQAVADHMLTKFIGQTPAGDGSLMKAAQFQTFLRDNRAALGQVFKPDELAAMDGIAADLRRTQLSETGAKLKGGSNTAQDTASLRKAGASGVRRTVLEGIAALAVGSGLHSTIASAAAFLGAVGIDAAFQAGVRNVNDLLTEAMLHPEVAKALLAKAPKAGAAPTPLLARALRQSALATFAAAHKGGTR